MEPSLNRRRFLTLLGSGLAVAAAPAVLVPDRRFWQVGALGRPSAFQAWRDQAFANMHAAFQDRVVVEQLYPLLEVGVEAAERHHIHGYTYTPAGSCFALLHAHEMETCAKARRADFDRTVVSETANALWALDRELHGG